MSHKSHSHNHDAPHDSMVGAIIALSVVSIVLAGIFSEGAWWAVLVKVILVVHMIKEIIMYISNAEVRKNYHYNTTGEDVLHFWIAYIIVNVAMNLIFPGDQWFARIAPAVLIIKAIETTIVYLMTKNRKSTQKQEFEHHHHKVHQHLYGQPQPNLRSARPMIRVVVETDDSDSYSEQSSLEKEVANYSSITVDQSTQAPSFCPMCGNTHDGNDRFCPSCGSELRS